jgi:hypothetical protein
MEILQIQGQGHFQNLVNKIALFLSQTFLFATIFELDYMQILVNI